MFHVKASELAIPLRNGSPTPFRLLTDEERAENEAHRATARRMWEMAGGDDAGWCLNTRRHCWVYLLETPEFGDDLTYAEMPEGFEEFWVRWKGLGTDTRSEYRMRISPSEVPDGSVF